MSFSKFLMEQQDSLFVSVGSTNTKLKEGGDMGGSLSDQLNNVNSQLENVLAVYQQTLKSHHQEWDELTNATGYFPPTTKISNSLNRAQRELEDALDHIERHQNTNYSG